MDTLKDIREDLQLTMDDLDDLFEVVVLLKRGHSKKARQKIRYLDTYVRDYCVEYFNEDMLRQFDMEGNGSQGKFTGRKYAYKELARMVEKSAALYLYRYLSSSKFSAKEFLDAQKTKNARKKLS